MVKLFRCICTDISWPGHICPGQDRNVLARTYLYISWLGHIFLGLNRNVLAKIYLEMTWPGHICPGQDRNVLTKTYFVLYFRSGPRPRSMFGSGLHPRSRLRILVKLFLNIFVNTYHIKCLFIYIRITQHIELKQILYVYFK